MHAPKAPSNFTSVPILFSAKPDAPLSKTLTKIDINHKKPDSNVTISGNYRHRVDLVYGPPNNRTYYEGTYDVLPVAVVEPVPFRVKLHTPATPIVRGGSLSLKVEVIRDANFTKDVVVKILTKPPGIGARSNIKITSKILSGIIRLLLMQALPLESGKLESGRSRRIWRWQYACGIRIC